MSLIHDALKSMDAPQNSQPAMAKAPKAAVRGRPAWLDAMLAFAIVLGAGILGWFVWQTQMKPKADPLPMAAAPTPAPAPAPVVVTPAVTETAAPGTASAMPLPAATAVAAAVPAPATAAVPADVTATAGGAPAPVAVSTPAVAVVAAGTPSPSPSMAPVAAPAPVAAVAMEPASPKSVVVASQRSDAATAAAPTAIRPGQTRQARSMSRSNAAAASAPASAPVVDDTPVELRFARFVAAMKESRGADAERELAALKERLPAGSLGLLRAQAWFDLRAGRDAAAADGYRAILDRMPGDEEASINLASIQSRQQKPEEARATLDASLRMQPDSAALRAALAQFTPAARQ